MSHYAKVINNIVVNVIVAEQDFIDSISKNSLGEWIQTSYNTRGNVHYGQDGQPDNGIALRGNYAGVGYIYDKEHDVFYPPSPFSSWKLNQNTWMWESPIPYPDDGQSYTWNEETTSWVEYKLTE
jgi:hypothetical protein